MKLCCLIHFIAGIIAGFCLVGMVGSIFGFLWAEGLLAALRHAIEPIRFFVDL